MNFCAMKIIVDSGMFLATETIENKEDFRSLEESKMLANFSGKTPYTAQVWVHDNRLIKFRTSEEEAIALCKSYGVEIKNYPNKSNIYRERETNSVFNDKQYLTNMIERDLFSNEQELIQVEGHISLKPDNSYYKGRAEFLTEQIEKKKALLETISNTF